MVRDIIQVAEKLQCKKKFDGIRLNKNLKKNAASKMLGLRENNFWVVRKTMCDNKILGDLRKENLGCEKIYFYLYFVSWIKI